jgi:hypothetical protein
LAICTPSFLRRRSTNSQGQCVADQRHCVPRLPSVARPRADLFLSPLSRLCGRGAGGEGLRRAPHEELPRCRSRSNCSQSLRGVEDGTAESVPVRSAAIDSRSHICVRPATFLS